MKDFLAKHGLQVLISLIVLLAAFILLKNWIGGERDFSYQTSSEKSAHFYKKSGINISSISIKIIYAVPRDKKPDAGDDWKKKLEEIMKEMQVFHYNQFRGISELIYELYKEPVVLENESIVYDTESTNRGNPNALKAITLELERRFPFFLKKDEAFRSLGIIYEGVGASGTKESFLFAKTFLDDPEYASVRSSLIYHEFGHTIGLPDQYDLETGDPYSNDIMGGGKYRPLDINYIDRNLLEGMGVMPE